MVTYSNPSSPPPTRVQPIPTLVDPLIPTCPWRRTRRRLGVKPSARLSCSWREPRWEPKSHTVKHALALISGFWGHPAACVTHRVSFLCITVQTGSICCEDQCELLWSSRWRLSGPRCCYQLWKQRLSAHQRGELLMHPTYHMHENYLNNNKPTNYTVSAQLSLHHLFTGADTCLQF